MLRESASGQNKVVEALLENNANIDYRNDWEGTALVVAAKEGNVEIAKLLLRKAPQSM